MKIFFEGFYGFKNAGDDAFVEVSSWGAEKYWNCNDNFFLGASLPETVHKIKTPNIKINALFNSRNIFKDSYITNELKPYKVTTGLGMDFIFVEREERKKITTSIIDNLIETHGKFVWMLRSHLQ